MDNDLVVGLIVAFLVISAICLLVFFVAREIFCWYWKINKALEVLESIDYRLSVITAQQDASRSVAPELANRFSFRETAK